MPLNGPDRYRGNGDQDWAALKGRGAGFAILKVTEGVSYDTSWYVRNIPRARQAGLTIGHYHMLSGSSSGSGAAQAAYFLSKADLQPGDIIPFMDFERSGQGTGSEAEYRQRGIDFVKAIHDAGFQCGIYGHERVAALFGSWKASGADAAWDPGDRIHFSDATLFQFGPFTTFPGVNSDGGDWSVALRDLPLIGGEDPDEMAYKDFAAGMDFRRDHPDQDLPAGSTPDFARGFHTAKVGDLIPGKQGPQGDPGPKGDKGDRGPRGLKGDTGPAGADGIGADHFHEQASKTGPAKTS